MIMNYGISCGVDNIGPEILRLDDRPQLGEDAQNVFEIVEDHVKLVEAIMVIE